MQQFAMMTITWDSCKSGNLRFLENFVFNCAGGATEPIPYQLPQKVEPKQKVAPNPPPGNIKNIIYNIFNEKIETQDVAAHCEYTNQTQCIRSRSVTNSRRLSAFTWVGFLCTISHHTYIHIYVFQ